MDDDQAQEHGNGSSASIPAGDRRTATETVRSRWTPKPEQILILESIFNSGMVNPPKEETVRIRKLLERFGAVGDANVFYWFQNRRSRSRRRQRQLQADLIADRRGITATAGDAVGLYEQHPSRSSSCSSSASSNCNSCGDGGKEGAGAGGDGFLSCSSSVNSSSYAACFMDGDDAGNDLFTISGQMGVTESSHSPFLCSSDASQLHYQSGTITVFINGIASEVPRGPLDVRAVFGPNVMLVHSSGQLLPANEYGILQHNLQNGESYFLVSETN